MRVKSVAAAAAVSTLLFAFAAPPASAGVPFVCDGIPFAHKLKTELGVGGSGFTCNLAVKLHVDPKDDCRSCLYLSPLPTNLLPGVGPLLKAEVVSICGDPIIFDKVVEGPNVFDGVIDGTVSTCIGGAQVSTSVPQEGKIKLNCNDGDVKTKGDFEYQCRPSTVP